MRVTVHCQLQPGPVLLIRALILTQQSQTACSHRPGGPHSHPPILWQAQNRTGTAGWRCPSPWHPATSAPASSLHGRTYRTKGYGRLKFGFTTLHNCST